MARGTRSHKPAAHQEHKPAAHQEHKPAAHQEHKPAPDAEPVHKHKHKEEPDNIDPNSKDPWDIFYYQHNRRLNY